MSKKQEENPIFSGDKAFNEERALTTTTTDMIDIEKERGKSDSEPHQFSLYHKSKKSGFNYDKLHSKMKLKFDEDHRFVQGRFLNHETPSGQIEFHMGPWEEIQTHVMMDGATYVVRKYVADYINANCRLTQYSDTPVEIAPGQKKYVPLLAGGKQRFNFIIENFINE